MKKKVLITGASKGIGKAITSRLAANENYQVTGTSRNANTIEDKIENVRYISLDLSDETSVQACLKEAEDADILINNAGIAQIGPVEELPVDKLRNIFEVNFFGQVTLTQAAVKAMRARGSGHIINISSLADKIAIPYLSGYCAAKAALASFTQCLRMELMNYGVKVSLIAPSDVNTDMKADLIFDNGSTYEKNVVKVDKAFTKNMASAPGPVIIAKKVEKILNSKNPKPIYNVGEMVGLIMFLRRSLPDRAVEKIVRTMYGV